MSVALIASEDVDEDFRKDWRRLEDEPDDPANPFCASWFLEPALRRLSGAERVRLLAVRRADGRLIGIAPVVRGRSYARVPAPHFSTWRHFHGYNNGAPLFARNATEEGRAAILRWIDGRPEGARFFRFMEQPLDGDDAMTTAGAGRAVVVQKDIRRAVLSGGRSFEAVSDEGFSGKKRKELRRQWRRLTETGALQFVRWTEPGDIGRAVALFVELERAGWKNREDDGRPIGASEAETRFFAEAMTEGAARGAAHCDVLQFDGRPAAMLFSLRLGGTLTMYKITYDESLSAYSPGVHLLVEATRRMLEDPSLRLFDSGTHDNHPVMDHLWRERMRVAQVNVSGAGRFNRALLRGCARLEQIKAILAPSRQAGSNGGRHVRSVS